jgi:hypothetical protein
MKLVPQLAIVTIVATAFLCAGRRAAADDDPLIAGRPLSAWLDQLRHGDDAGRTNAASTLSGIGPNCPEAILELEVLVRVVAMDIDFEFRRRHVVAPVLLIRPH